MAFYTGKLVLAGELNKLDLVLNTIPVGMIYFWLYPVLFNQEDKNINTFINEYGLAVFIKNNRSQLISELDILTKTEDGSTTKILQNNQLYITIKNFINEAFK